MCCATYIVCCPDNVEHYLRVNPGSMEVKKVRGGWRPVDKSQWLGGKEPIKGELITNKK